MNIWNSADIALIEPRSDLMRPTHAQLADTLLKLGEIQTLWDSISPKSLVRLAELGMVRRADNQPPQLTTLGELVFARAKVGEPVPDLDHLA